MSEMVRTPHDSFFKGAFAMPEVTREFLARYLPPTVVERLDLNILQLEKDSFVREDLRKRYGDLLYRTSLKRGGDALVYVLFDHKSSPDPDALLQVLGYMLEIWRREAAVRREQRVDVFPLPPIIPLLFHHGEQPWSHPVRFEDLIAARDVLQTYTPKFTCQLFDLTPLPDEMIQGGVMLLAPLLLLKHVFDPGLPEFVDVFFRKIPSLLDQPNGRAMLKLLLGYLAETGRDVEPGRVRAVMREVFDARGEEVMKTMAEKWVEKGIEKGIERGLEKGRIEELHDSILEFLLEFAERVPADLEAMIRSIDDAEKLRVLRRKAYKAKSIAAFREIMSR